MSDLCKDDDAPRRDWERETYKECDEEDITKKGTCRGCGSNIRRCSCNQLSAFLELAKDHYWDTLQKDRDVIIHHIKWLISVTEEQ